MQTEAVCLAGSLDGSGNTLPRLPAEPGSIIMPAPPGYVKDNSGRFFVARLGQACPPKGAGGVAQPHRIACLLMGRSEGLQLAVPSRWLDRPLAGYLLVGAAAAAVVFWQLGRPTLDEHEAKAALAARGMIQTDEWLLEGSAPEDLPADTLLNRWLIPVNNGRPRLVKTPLPYWIAAAVSLPEGDVNEWTARLPSAAAAVLCALATLALGRQVFSPRSALMGALMLVTCVGFQKWGRDARPEMLQCLFMTLAMAWFYAGLSARSGAARAGWMTAFWVAMGLANLTKEFFPMLMLLPLAAFLCWRTDERQEQAGMLPPGRGRRRLARYAVLLALAVALAITVTTVPALAWWKVVGVGATVGGMASVGGLMLLPLAWYAWRSRPWREVAGLLPTAVLGAVLMLGMFLPWMWYMHHLFQAVDVYREQVTERVAGTGGWAAAEPYYYLVPLVEMTLPWLGFLPGAFAVAWMKRFSQYRSGLVYLFLWSVGLVALLTASAGKREHYLLPMAPAICLVMGFVAEDVFFNHRWIGAGAARLLGICYGLVGLVAPVVVGALWLISSRPEQWARLLKSTRLAETLPDPSAWQALAGATILVAAPMALVLAAAIRRRLAPICGLLVAAALALYLGFYARADLWDDRAAIAGFARMAAATVPPGDPVGSWGDPQAKTVFYFHRNIPNVLWVNDRLVGAGDDHLPWEAWMSNPANVAWVLTYAEWVEPVERFGFRVVKAVNTGQRKGSVMVLMARPGGRAGGASQEAVRP
jgi:4-amino-4-deoxy-L-arabinose transferase-like glycosyltransferase